MDEPERAEIMCLMDRFALARTWTWHQLPTRARYCIRRYEDPPQTGVDRALAELNAELHATLSLDWIGHVANVEVVHRPPAEPYEYDPDRHRIRIAAMVEKLRAAGIDGATEVLSTLPGWLTPVEMAVDGIVERCGLHEGPRRVAIRQIKEKWGTLKFYTTGEPAELAADIATIARWAEACTVGRCAITGRPGAAVGPGWILTLSPEMKELREDDFQEFQKLLDQK